MAPARDVIDRVTLAQHLLEARLNHRGFLNGSKAQKLTPLLTDMLLRNASETGKEPERSRLSWCGKYDDSCVQILILVSPPRICLAYHVDSDAGLASRRHYRGCLLRAVVMTNRCLVGRSLP